MDRTVDKLILRAIATDGGTAYLEAVVGGEDGWQFYRDGKVGSDTWGELFFDFPASPDEMIEPRSAFAISVKEKWENVDYES